MDKKEDKEVIVLWKKLAIVASLLVFITIGYQLTKEDELIIKPENTIVKDNKKENPFENKKETVVESEIIKPEIDKEKIDAIFNKDNEVQSFVSSKEKIVIPTILKDTTSVNLNEIVVIGYGSTKKLIKTSSNTITIDPKQMTTQNNFIQNQSNSNPVIHSLQGRVAGINISSSTGVPGTSKM
ncbi:MAG: hypothetical protein HC854_17335 [Flavobacterium sp.]|nr:hypothetical protein [Flavobacterium sp.]